MLEKRTPCLKVSLSQSELQLMTNLSEKLGISISQYIRHQCLPQAFGAPLTFGQMADILRQTDKEEE